MSGCSGLSAAILVGGQSRRMGTNKALLRPGPGGTTIVETVARRLHEVADEVFLVGSESTDYEFLGLPQIVDVIPDRGALGGIYSALVTARKPHALIVACDLPFLSVSLLRYMVSLRRDYDVLVPVIEQLQPLHAIYSRNCIPLIEQSLQSGLNKVTGWFEQANVRTLNEDMIQRYDPTLLSTYNMNTPDSLAFVKRMLTGEIIADGDQDVEALGGR